MLIYVAAEVVGHQAGVCTFIGTLEQVPHAFDGVRAGAATGIFPASVVDDIVLEAPFYPVVNLGLYLGTCRNASVDEECSYGRINVLRDHCPHLPGAFPLFHGTNYCHLILEVILVSDATATDVRLVNFNCATQLLKAAVGRKRRPDAMVQKLRRFLGDTEGTRHFVGADAVLGINDNPYRRQPLIKAKRAIFKNGVGLHGELALRMR